MRKILFTIAMMAFSLCINADDVMTKESDGTYIVNTTSLCQKKGYKATTPLLVYIRKDRIVKVEALPSRETPKYYKLVKEGMLPVFSGKKAKDVKGVDAITGATMSSEAVRENVKAALAYYKKNKKKVKK